MNREEKQEPGALQRAGMRDHTVSKREQMKQASALISDTPQLLGQLLETPQTLLIPHNNSPRAALGPVLLFGQLEWISVSCHQTILEQDLLLLSNL